MSLALDFFRPLINNNQPHFESTNKLLLWVTLLFTTSFFILWKRIVHSCPREFSFDYVTGMFACQIWIHVTTAAFKPRPRREYTPTSTLSCPCCHKKDIFHITTTCAWGARWKDRWSAAAATLQKSSRYMN